MAKLDALQGLLELVSAAGGTIDARIRIQKEAFLLAASEVGRFNIASFDYHHYGPYSRELSDALQFAVSAELLEEVKELVGDSTYRYSYNLTGAGRQFLEEAGGCSDRTEELASAMSGYHWRALELAATVRYLELHGTVASREAAFHEALQLKPETRSYKQSAEQLFKDVLH